MASDYNLFTILMHFLWMIALIVHLSYLVDSYLCIIVKRVVLVCELKWIANSRRLSNFDLIFVFVHSHSIECAITAVAKYHSWKQHCFHVKYFFSLSNGHCISTLFNAYTFSNALSSKGDSTSIQFIYWIQFFV